MSLAVVQHEQNCSDTRVEILCLLRKAHSQVQVVASLVESNACCLEILWGLLEVQRALCFAAGQLAADRIEHCLAVAFQTSDSSQQRQSLTEVIDLYALVCR